MNREEALRRTEEQLRSTKKMEEELLEVKEYLLSKNDDKFLDMVNTFSELQLLMRMERNGI
jgi:hypothetical protein